LSSPCSPTEPPPGEDKLRFVHSLVKPPDSVVVWDPISTDEAANPKDKPKKLGLLMDAIRRL
jgi:hypothetical protein